ncbi:MAG: hypothetical protein J0M29_09780 [Chitinophagales bacterium]|nr:hypothetical protein [Chitinophagales bacterium]
MENTADIIRDLANLYGIEILDNPTGHLLIDSNGVERPFVQGDIINHFGLNTSDVEGASTLDCRLVNTDFKLNNQRSTIFQTQHSETTELIANNQYALAA